MITVGKKAPSFSCAAVKENKVEQLSLEHFKDSYKLLFFYPLDFTFVCPTELHALEEYKTFFHERNVAVLATSVDSVYSHQAWLSTPKEQGGIKGVSYYLLSDITKKIAQDYGVLQEEAGVALRAVFVLDKQDVVQYASIQNLSLGRNIPELIRVIDAIMHVEKHGEVCPVNWQAGKKAMKATHEGVLDYFNSLQ